MNQVRLLVNRLMPQDAARLQNLFVLLWDISSEDPQQFANRFRNEMIIRGMVWQGFAVCNACDKWVMIILNFEDHFVPIRLCLLDLYFWAFFTPNGWYKFGNCPLNFEPLVACTDLGYKGSYSSLKYDYNVRFGFSTLRDMICVVSTHTGDPYSIRRSLLQPILFVSESVRFHVVSDLLTRSYNTYCILDGLTLDRIKNWRKICKARIALNFEGVLNLNVRNIQDAGHVLATIKANTVVFSQLGPINLEEEADNGGGAGRGVGGGLGGRGAHRAAPINPRGRGHRARANRGARQPARMNRIGRGHDNAILYMKTDLNLLNLLVQCALSTAKERMTCDNVSEITKLLLSGGLNARNKAPVILKSSENQTKQEALEIGITKLLLKPYYDMVNHTKRELHNVLLTTLYKYKYSCYDKLVLSEDLFEQMLKEPQGISAKRGHVRETLKDLQQSYKTLDVIPPEAENVEKGYADLSVMSNPTPAYSFLKHSISSPKPGHSGDHQTFLQSSPDANGFGHSTVGVSPGSSGEKNTSNWGISSIFGGEEDRAPPDPKENFSMNKYSNVPPQPLNGLDQSFSIIQLREPPVILKPAENQTEQEVLEIAITKLLLKLYYDTVTHTKEELDNVLTTLSNFSCYNKLVLREDLFVQMLNEPDGISAKRDHVREMLKVLQQSYKTLDVIPLEAENVEKGYADLSGMSNPTTVYSFLKHSKSSRKSGHSVDPETFQSSPDEIPVSSGDLRVEN